MHVIMFSSRRLDSVAVAIFAGIASERYIEEGGTVKVMSASLSAPKFEFESAAANSPTEDNGAMLQVSTDLGSSNELKWKKIGSK